MNNATKLVVMATAMALLQQAALAATVEEGIFILADSDRGVADVELTGLPPLEGLVISTSGTALVTDDTRGMVPADPAPEQSYPGIRREDGVLLFTIPWPSGFVGARIASTTAQDVDLYVGYTGGGVLGGASTLVCSSVGPGNEERCTADHIPWLYPSSRAWVMARNRVPSSPGATDEIVVETWVESPSHAHGLSASGPTSVGADGVARLSVRWADLRLEPGTRLEGHLLIESDSDEPVPVPVSIVRSDAPGYAPTAMVVDQPVSVRLLPGSAQDGLFIDVPPGANVLTFQSSGEGDVTLHAAWAQAGPGPLVQPAPPVEDAVAVSTQAGADDQLVIDGAMLQPGRWYVTPVNNGTTLAEFTLTAWFGGEFAHAPQPGPWFNPERSGAGLFLYNTFHWWSLLWYTYLEDGTPTWYEGQGHGGPPYQFTLFRHSEGADGILRQEVGTLLLTQSGDQSASVSWTVDGRSGSEAFVRIDGGGCGVPDASGPWYPPEQVGRGLSVTVYPQLESIAAYFYDDEGVARWVIGSASPVGSRPMTMYQYQGAGPLAPYQPPTQVAIGTLEATFPHDSATTGELLGTLDVDLQLGPPLSGAWSVSLPIQRIGLEQGCE